jgi:hypothetical protein
MANIDSLISRVRVELGDLGKSFVTQFVADGSTNRFKLHYAPLDSTTVTVQTKLISNGTTYDITNNAHIEESTGVFVLLQNDGVTPLVPADGDELTVAGNYYRYFTGAELTQLINDAVSEHASNATDSTGRKVTLATLPSSEEYPVAVYATTLALYTLATDAAFDIDIQAPDGVSIPRSERYRQLMDMVQTRHAQYRELCALMGVGLYRIEVFDLNRISKMTNRLIPRYVPQEVDDRSYPERVNLPEPTLGNKPPAWPTEAGELSAYQGLDFTETLVFNGNYAGKTFIANLLNQRSSVLVVQPFTLEVATTGTDVITAAARTSGSTTITLTTSAAHGLTAGNAIAITDVDATVNGIGTVATVVNTTQFTVTGTATTALSKTGLTGQVETSVAKNYTFTLSLTQDQTLRTAERTYWSLSTIDAFTGEQVEIKGGKFFTVRSRTTVL